MKRIRRIASILLTVAMLAAMLCQTAFADETTYTISVNENDTHRYVVYQIFTGTPSKDESENVKLTDIKWGKNGTGTEGTAVGDSVIEALTAVNNDKTDIEKINVIKNYADFGSSGGVEVTANNPISVVPGYYLIQDNGAAQMEFNDAKSIYLIQVVAENIEIKTKKGAPGFTKEVMETNDTTADTSWGSVADYDIGDEVPFRLTVTLPKDLGNYETYKLSVYDTLSEGLNFNKDSVKVYLDDNIISSDSYTVTENDEDYNTTFSVKFANIKEVEGVESAEKIVVEYTATLNKDAVIGGEGNNNEAWIEYSDNPHGDSVGTSVQVNAKVYTFMFTVNKVDESQSPLAGAEFELYKVTSEGQNKVALVTSKDGTSFTATGLDAGTYILKETKAPDGYNKASDIEFTISAVYNENNELTSLSAGNDDMTISIDSGSIEVDVENKSGSSLPTTGGIGTTILYVVGGILIVSAGVALITKKRIQDEK